MNWPVAASTISKWFWSEITSFLHIQKPFWRKQSRPSNLRCTEIRQEHQDTVKQQIRNGLNSFDMIDKFFEARRQWKKHDLLAERLNSLNVATFQNWQTKIDRPQKLRQEKYKWICCSNVQYKVL